MNAEHARAISYVANFTVASANLRKTYDEIRRKAEAGWRQCSISLSNLDIEEGEGFESTYKTIRAQLEENGFEVGSLLEQLTFIVEW